jgi:tetratricopeptide (TPR) repeat protein
MNDARWQLAVELANLSRILACNDERHAALAAAHEYATITRELAASTPGGYANALAISLTKVSKRFSDLGRLEDALSTVWESVDIHRDRAAAEPYIRSGAFAEALDQFSVVLLGLRRHADALRASEDAVDLYTALQDSLGTYTSELERSLLQLARVLDALRRPAVATAARVKAASLAAPLTD